MMNIIGDDEDIYESLKQSGKLKNIDEKVIDLAIQTLKTVSDN
jgi:hypothetical protein